MKCHFAKSNLWTGIFLSRVVINKALPISTQSFASFICKMKPIEAERCDLTPKNCSGFEAEMWEQSVLVPSQLITTAQKVVAMK